MTWADGRLCAYDCETTGTDPETARIVSASVVLVGGGLQVESFSVLIDPGVEIPEEAAAVHGITTAKARAAGLPPQTTLAGIVSSLAAAVEAGYPLVVFNARYDLTVLDRECRRHEVTGLDWARLLVVDPLVIDKHLDRYRKGSRKLDAICAYRGAVLEEAHDAAADALAAARLAWVIAKKGGVIRRVRNPEEGRELAALRREWEQVRNDLPALHQAQVGWAAEQARGLAEYFAEQGKPEHVDTDWPLVPLRALAA